MIQAVLFDLDGTLWDRDEAFRALVASQHRTFPELIAVARDRYLSRLIELDEHGIGDKHAAYAQVVLEFGLPPGLGPILFDDFATTYACFFDPFPDAIPTLRWLRDQRLKLGIITNGTIEVQESKIHGLGLAPLMDTVLISEREGASEAGLTAVWRKSWGEAAHATHTITALNELIPL